MKGIFHDPLSNDYQNFKSKLNKGCKGHWNLSQLHIWRSAWDCHDPLLPWTSQEKPSRSFFQSNLLLSSPARCMHGSAASSTGTVCNVPWTKPQHLNTVIRARAGYWLNYTWKQRHLREARGLNIMINYGLIREDKSQLNKNNTGLHAAGEGSVFKCIVTLSFWKTCMFKVSINIWNLKIHLMLVWSF